MSEDRGPRVEDLSFLLGRWVGTGTWNGGPFTCRTHVTLLFGRFLQIDVEAQQRGRSVHHERAMIHPYRDALAAVLFPDGGEVQRFAVVEIVRGDAYTLVYTPSRGRGGTPQRWSIVRREEGGYRERFDVAADGQFQTMVECTYRAE